jgi:hypothetical protein
MNADLFSSSKFSDNSQSFMNCNAKYIGMLGKSDTTSKDTKISSSVIVCCPNDTFFRTPFRNYLYLRSNCTPRLMPCIKTGYRVFCCHTLYNLLVVDCIWNLIVVFDAVIAVYSVVVASPY